MNNRENALIELEKNLDTILPQNYKDFLLSYDGRQNYMHKEVEGKYWQLASLCKEKGFHLLGYEFCNGLKMHADIIREYNKTDVTEITGTGELFSLDVLSKCIVIGYENGDYLFLHREDFSIWIFWHDGSDCQKLADSFDIWLNNSNEEYEPIPEMVTDKKFNPLIEKYSGIWRESNTNDPYYLELRTNSIAVEHFNDDSGGEGLWRVIDNKQIGILIETKGFKLDEEKYTVLNCSENTLDLKLDDDYQVSFVKADEIKF